MKPIIKILILLTVAAIIGISCKKKEQQEPGVYIIGCTDPSAINYDPLATIDNAQCIYVGYATFWYNSPGTSATVTIAGQSAYVTGYYSAYDPICGADECANFTLQTGYYSYHAVSFWNSWDGYLYVNTNECTLILLK